jgi:hypothetical protein
MSNFPVDSFFLEDTLTVSCTFGSSTLKVHFVNEYDQTLMSEQQGPGIYCKTSDISAMTHSSSVVIGGVTYYVQEIMPDGTGISFVRLSKDAP